MADLNWGTSVAAPVTLSFWVYSSVAGTHGGGLRNGNNDHSYPFSYSINTANTWQYQTITIPGDTGGSWFSNNNTGLQVLFNLGTVATYSSTANGTWQAGNYFNSTGSVNIVTNANGSFYITGVQLEKGAQATSFDWRHYGTELALCQRYYQKWTAAWQGVSAGAGYQYTASTGFSVTMRATPTAGVISQTNSARFPSSAYSATNIYPYGITIAPLEFTPLLNITVLLNVVLPTTDNVLLNVTLPVTVNVFAFSSKLIEIGCIDALYLDGVISYIYPFDSKNKFNQFGTFIWISSKD